MNATFGKDQAVTHTTVSDGLTLVRELAGASRSDMDSLRQRAQAWVAAFDAQNSSGHQRHRARTSPERKADGWIVDILSSTESAISREQLLDDFIKRYRDERGIKDLDHHDGPWLFVFHAPDAKRPLALEGLASAGVHPEAFIEQCTRHLAHAQVDPFLDVVFGAESDIDGWHALSFGGSAGSPLFNALLATDRRMSGEPDYWVSAVCLPGNGREGPHGLFLLHRNAGNLLDPVPSPTMRQDARLLVVVSLAWRQLEHQIKSLAKLTEQGRRELIQLLAPGLMAHEIGASVQGLQTSSLELLAQLKGLALANRGHVSLELAARRSHGIARHCGRLHAVTDAFNNLDKRSPNERATLQAVCEQVRLLLTVRLGEVGVDLAWDEARFAAERLETDVVLLLHALLNLCSNALNAFEEAPKAPPAHNHTDPATRQQLHLQLLPPQGGLVRVLVQNNGPVIAAADRPYIFRRGYTTRARGHGQGLYLARLIALYLGGELRLADVQALAAPMTVGFVLSLAPHLLATQGVARAALDAES
jgi:signal transduction histidine kinase